MSEKFDSDQWNLLARRVLIKDLRCGITSKTLNKIVGKTEWKIPVFEVQLATDSKGHPKKLAGEVMIEPKLDGCLLYTSPSPRDRTRSRMPSSA